MSDLPRNLRRLREEPLDIVTRLVEELGLRRATSLGEARAAAHLDGRLRRAGLHVSVDAFATIESPGWDGLVLGGLALLCAALHIAVPLLALLCGVAALLLACAVVWRNGEPLLGRRGASQNVIGTRASEAAPHWRIALLVPLDTPLTMNALARRLADGPALQIGRLAACAALVLLALVGLLDARRWWWYAQWLPSAYLLLLALIEGRLLRAPASPGAVSHTGALAVLIASVEALVPLDNVELWTVGLGATANGSGLADFLRRYPFERSTTLFITLEGLGSGTLSYLTRQGLLYQHAADPLLLRLADAADAHDPLIDAEPRSIRLHPTTSGALFHPARRALTITCLGADNHVPHRATNGDTPEIIAGDVLERTVRLVTGLLQQIDASDEDAA